MSVLRTIKCDVKKCNSQYVEQQAGDGWPGWGSLNGIVLDGVTNPSLCPNCLRIIAETADNLGAENDLDKP